MSDNKGFSLEDFVTWKAVGVILTLVTVLMTGIYAVASTANEIAQDSKYRIGVLEERQSNQYLEIKESLKRIEDSLGIKADK